AGRGDLRDGGRATRIRGDDAGRARGGAAVRTGAARWRRGTARRSRSPRDVRGAKGSPAVRRSVCPRAAPRREGPTGRGSHRARGRRPEDRGDRRRRRIRRSVGRRATRRKRRGGARRAGPCCVSSERGCGRTTIRSRPGVVAALAGLGFAALLLIGLTLTGGGRPTGAVDANAGTPAPVE